MSAFPSFILREVFWERQYIGVSGLDDFDEISAGGEGRYVSKPHRVNPSRDDYDLYPKIDDGTTVLGFVFKHGVMLAFDHPKKSPVPNVVEVDSFMVAAISGGNEFLLKEWQKLVRVKQYDRWGKMSVEEASRFLTDFAYPPVSVGILIGGFEETGEVALYHVNRKGRREDIKDTMNTNTGAQGIFATGSGAPYAIGYVERRLTHDMSVAEAKELAKSAICFASILADESGDESGDFVSVYYIGSRECKQLVCGEEREEGTEKKNRGERPPFSPRFR